MAEPTINLKFPSDFFKNYARDKPCQVRVASSAGFQCGPTDTTVLAHPSVAGLKAMGSRKASVPDIGAAWACCVCHDLVDGRMKPRPTSFIGVCSQAEQQIILKNAHYEGVLRTIAALVKAGVLPNP